MPPRLAAQDFEQELLILFDAYVHGTLDRRGFLVKAQKFATAGVTAVGLLAAVSPNFAAGQQVPQDDARLKTERPSVPSPAGNGSVKGYLARPAGAGTARLPAVLVIHENRGLNPHIEDIARRLALDGFMAFAPDALTPLGGYPADEEKARTLFATTGPVEGDGGFFGRQPLAQVSTRRHGPAGCGGLLLRRRHRAPAGRAPAGPGSGRAVLRQHARALGSGQSQGAPAGPPGVH
ncbi:Dienelactone hydrolase family [Polaromonas sp. CG9_12]|nr:Dienelactone hydrolase family [Polaromonas sp. CG9_12]